MNLHLRLVLLICALSVEALHAERILFVLPLATRSETHLFLPLAKELALKGHEVTFLSPVKSGFVIKNFKEIIILQPLDVTDFEPTSPNPLEGRRLAQNKFAWLVATSNLSYVSNGCHKVYQNEEFQKLYRESFDLLVISGLFNNCFNGLVHKFQAPFVYFISLPVSGYFVHNTVGLHMPPSFVPFPVFDYSDRMTFIERFSNTLLTWMFSAVFTHLIAPDSEKIYRQYLGQDYPSISSIEKNISLIMSNSHFSLTTARPVLPDVIEIGGIHCREPTLLPKDLDDFLSEGKDGFIFFSFGSVVKGVNLPDETKQIFLNVFSRLKQRVLWKWENEQMPDLPANVKIGKWLPQQDILGHRNIRFFITHGGLLSTQEAAYHGVPVIGIPFFVDQDANMQQAKLSGYAITLEILDLTEDILEDAINDMLTNPRYKKKAQEVSKIFKDQPEPPLNRAVYWTEYVLRHKGANHLRSAARDLNYFQYHSYDVVAMLCATLFVFIIIIVKIIRRFCCSKTADSVKFNTKKRQ